MQHGGPEHGDAQHGGLEHGDAQHPDPEHGHNKVFSYPVSTVMFYATPWFEMLCGKRRVDECSIESDLGRGCSTAVPSTATPSTAVPSTGTPRYFHIP